MLNNKMNNIGFWWCLPVDFIVICLNIHSPEQRVSLNGHWLEFWLTRAIFSKTYFYLWLWYFEALDIRFENL